MADKKLKLMAYQGDRASCWYHRLHAPLSYLAKNHFEDYDISISGRLDTRHIGLFDLVILQRQHKKEVLEPILKMKKKGTKLIYEIDDDLFHIPKWNPAYAELGARNVQDGIKNFLSQIDAMFVTTDPLADVYKNYCRKIYVLPNSIDHNLFFPSPNNAEKKVVCWQGSMTHEKDIRIMKDAVECMARHPDVFVKMWCGFQPGMGNRDPIFDIPGAHTVPLVPFEAFYSMFSQIDGYVGLAPLATVPFNRGKSNLKFLEYTAQGMVTVASDFDPYRDTIVHNETGILISNNQDWYDEVMDLIEDEAKYYRILGNAQNFVFENFDITKNYLLWKTAIEEIMGAENGTRKTD